MMVKLYQIHGHTPHQRPDHLHMQWNDVTDPRVFKDAQAARREIAKVGEHYEPSTQWFEDGSIMFEARWPDRTGLHLIRLLAVRCFRQRCIKEQAQVAVAQGGA